MINIVKNGAVIASEKKVGSSLIDESTVEKVSLVCPGVGMVYSGMGPDARVLLSKSRKIAQEYFQTYREYPSVKQLVKSVATVMQEFTQSGGVRPFGVSLLVVGGEEDGPGLYQVDPSGSYWAWKASSIGKGSKNAKSFLEKRYNEEMGIEDAIHMAILTMKEGFEGIMDEKNIEIGVYSKGKFEKLTTSAIKDYLDNLM